MANENKVLKIEGAPVTERKFLILEEAKIPRGASNYTLPKGKTISSQGYDIDALQSMGVKMKEVTV